MLVLSRFVGEGFVLLYKGKALGRISISEIRYGDGDRKARIAIDLDKRITVLRDELLDRAVDANPPIA